MPRAGADEITRDGDGEAMPMVLDGLVLTVDLVGWNNLLVTGERYNRNQCWGFQARTPGTRRYRFGRCCRC